MTIPIVVVDDEEVDRYLVQRVIKNIDVDAKVIEYIDGQPFVEVIRDQERASQEIGAPPPPILVLLDINMPRMGGFEVLDALKADLGDEDRVMFVTMYSSSDHAQDRADAERYAFVKDYIVKPATEEKLTALISRLYPEEYRPGR